MTSICRVHLAFSGEQRSLGRSKLA